LTRELVNEPANRMTPSMLAERARAMAAEQRLDCEILDRDRMKQLGMGSLLGVAMGSAEPPAMIVLRYKPAGKAAQTAHLGLIASDDGLREKVMSAAAAEGEKMWQMPLDEDYKDYLKSAFADLPNIGGRWGGAITAATFLKEFADSTPWVHLDIAGTAWLDDAKPYLSKGPSGVAVRTLVRLATGW